MRERTARHVAVRMRQRTGQIVPEHERPRWTGPGRTPNGRRSRAGPVHRLRHGHRHRTGAAGRRLRRAGSRRRRRAHRDPPHVVRPGHRIRDGRARARIRPAEKAVVTMRRRTPTALRGVDLTAYLGQPPLPSGRPAKNPPDGKPIRKQDAERIPTPSRPTGAGPGPTPAGHPGCPPCRSSAGQPGRCRACTRGCTGQACPRPAPTSASTAWPAGRSPATRSNGCARA